MLSHKQLWRRAPLPSNRYHDIIGYKEINIDNEENPKNNISTSLYSNFFNTTKYTLLDYVDFSKIRDHSRIISEPIITENDLYNIYNQSHNHNKKIKQLPSILHICILRDLMDRDNFLNELVWDENDNELYYISEKSKKRNAHLLKMTASLP